MGNYEVVKYSPLLYNEWNEFVKASKNGTFLFHRDFMEYHQDRFEDFSLMVFKKKKLVAILPANKLVKHVYSHQGLTYGGLVLPNKSSFQSAVKSLYAILKFCSEQNMNTVVLKQLPKIYHLRPSDELDYLLFILKAKVIRRDISMAIPMSNKMAISTLRKRQLKVAFQNDLHVKQEKNLASFWNEVLIPNLKETYGVQPVHSLLEIQALRDKFPNNIKQFSVFLENELLAGCTVFETKNIAHIQYMSTEKERNLGALDFLMDKLINEVYKDKVYFDFGISNENNGKNVNLGLLNWKQSFGASSVVHDFYEIETNNCRLLKGIFI